jgi:hypothetical protein
MANDWSREEVEAIVNAYFRMLKLELRGESFNKTVESERLEPFLRNRSKGSIGRKHSNISAVLIELGFPYISGYKPLSNYQGLLYDVIRERLVSATELVDAIRTRADEPIVVPTISSGDLLTRVVDPPAHTHARRASVIADRARPRRIADFFEIEARNRKLGAAGEEFVMRFEAQRLWRAGQRQLADRVEHVARTRGDGEGYDILSFEDTGRERLIEVKTTTFGPYTPFFVTRNEVDVSHERSDRYFVYRLFHFRDDPRVFVVSGDIGSSFALDAVQFSARLR